MHLALGVMEKGEAQEMCVGGGERRTSPDHEYAWSPRSWICK